jgi:hypothetical protein
MGFYNRVARSRTRVAARFSSESCPKGGTHNVIFSPARRSLLGILSGRGSNQYRCIKCRKVLGSESYVTGL